MTAQQRAVVGLGETVHKAGVPKGWWGSEVVKNGEVVHEPVYSLACQSEGLWALSGTKVCPRCPRN